MADAAVDKVMEEGHVLEAAEALAALEHFAKTIRQDERFVHFLRDELMKHGGKYKTASGTQLEVCEAGVRYNYSHDDEWQRLQAQMESISERMRTVEAKLRSVPPGRLWVDPDTGEVVQGAQKQSTSTYRITLAK